MATPGFKDRWMYRRDSDMAQRTLNHIRENLEGWDQENINTCFAGHTLLLNGYTWEATHPGVYYFRGPDGKIVGNALAEAASELGFLSNEAKFVFCYYPEESVTKEEAYAELERRVLAVLEHSPILSEDGSKWKFGPNYQ